MGLLETLLKREEDVSFHLFILSSFKNLDIMTRSPPTIWDHIDMGNSLKITEQRLEGS